MVSGRLIARNTLINIAAQGVPLLIAVPTIPLIAQKLGPGRFGLLGLAWVLLGYLAYFDLGMSRAATRFVADAMGRRDDREIPEIVWSAAALQLVIGCVGGVLLFVISPVLASRVLHTAPSEIHEATATFRVLALGFPVVLLVASFRGVLEAAQRFDAIAGVTIPAGAMVSLVPMIGSLRHWSLEGIVSVLVGLRVIVVVAFLVIGSRLVPNLWRPRATRSRARRLLPFGIWTSLSNVLSPLFDSADRFLLGAFQGLGAVGLYTAPQEMILRFRVVPNSLAVTLFPAFTSLNAGEQHEQLVAHYRRGVQALALFLGLVAVCVVLLGPDLLSWWLGESLGRPAGPALQVLAIGLVCNGVAFVPMAYLHAINRPEVPAKLHLTEVFVFAALAYALMPRYAVTGAAMVWTARAGLDAALLLRAAHRHGGRGSVGTLLTTGVILAIAMVASHVISAVPGRASLAVLICGLLLVASWLLLKDGDRRLLLTVVHGAVR